MSQELVVLNDYAVAQMDAMDLQEVLAENLEGEAIRPQDLDKIKIPSGGGLSWEVPDIEEGVVPKRSIKGVIIYKHNHNNYYAAEYDGGGEPPDCYSNDCISGIGNPGGSCANCPLNAWGSAKKGNGKACSNKTMLFLLMPDSLLPVSVDLPPTSAAIVRTFFLKLSSKALKYSDIVVDLSLEKKKGAGPDYSALVIKMDSKLNPEEKAKIAGYRESIVPSLKSAMESARVPLDDVVDVEFDDEEEFAEQES